MGYDGTVHPEIFGDSETNAVTTGCVLNWSPRAIIVVGRVLVYAQRSERSAITADTAIMHIEEFDRLRKP